MRNRLVHFFQRQTRLRTVLLVPFVLQIVGTVSLVSYLYISNSNRAVNELALQLQIQAGKQVEEHLNYYFQAPQAAIQFMVDAVESGNLDIKNQAAVEHYLWRLSQIFPKISYLNYGFENGLFIGLGRADNFSNRIYIEQALPGNRQILYQYESLPGGKRGKLLKKLDFGDFHNQVWYQQPKAAGRFAWTDIYNWEDNPEIIVIGSGQPLLNSSGQSIGVVGVDLFLANIQDYLRSLKVTPNSQVFIVERNGKIVATSAEHAPFVLDNNRAKRLSLLDFPDPLIQASGKSLYQQFANFKAIKTATTLSFRWQGQRQLMRVTPWREKQGLDWLIGVTIPESDFTHKITESTNRTLLLSITALILALLIGGYTADWITIPILRLNQAAKDLTIQNFEAINIGKRNDEVGELADTFNQMAVQLKQSFETLEVDQQRLIDFLEAVPVGIVIYYADGRLFFVNRTGRSLLFNDASTTTEEFPSTQHFPLYQVASQEPYPPHQLPSFLALQGHPATAEDLEIHLAHQVIPVQMTATPVLSEEGKVEYAIAIFQDISERKKSEKILTRYNQDLEQQVQERTQDLERSKQAAEIANRTKSEFLANISHEIRTPLNAILGFCDLLQGAIAEPLSRSYLEAISSSGKTLLALINDILDLSRIEAGKLKIHYESVEIRQLISEVRQIFSEKAKQKNIQLLTTIADTVPKQIQFDPIRLRQILFNVVGNALKFTEKGSINMRVDCHYQTLDTLDLILSVEDTGIGIAPQNQQRIFEAFTQSEGQSTRQYGGTGLGLTITRRLTEMLGGSIQLESQLGKGSRFQFTFPQVVVDHSIISHGSPVDNDLNQFVPAKILIVDNVASNRELMRGFFQTTDHQILEASNGQEAIQIAQTSQPNLILMDWFMSYLDSQAVIVTLRHLSETQTIPILIVAASLSPELKANAQQYVQGFLLKPITRADLVRVFKGILPLRKIASPTALVDSRVSDTPEPVPNPLLSAIAPEASETIERLPELISKLEAEEHQIWCRLRQTMIMRELRQFAQRLEAWADEYHSTVLRNYALTLEHQIQEFDGDNLSHTVNTFPEVRATLENQYLSLKNSVDSQALPNRDMNFLSQ
ncbi:MAG: ATP-binding protein [Snowella sp.]|nr:ATP-binding protein [Snowella sp.]